MADTDEVKKLAALARLSIPEGELESFAKEFEGILAYVGKLDELSLPAHHERPVPAVRNAFREDAEPHEPRAHTHALVEQFPEREGNALKVKQIISYD